MKTTETLIEDPHSDSEALPNPLERFVAGGWKRGIVRLLAGLAVIALVVSFTGAESIDRLLDPRLAPFLLLGAAVHLTQRVARIIKWARMIAPTTLVKHSMLYLLRIQFIGMMANLLLPLSEGLKVWAVSRTRAQAKVAAESIVAETALHALLVGVAGALGIVTVANRPSTLTITVAIMVSAPLLLLLAMKRWPRDQASRIAVVDGRVAGWCVIETSCQLAIYAITLHALGVDLTLSLLLALSPVLFLADLIMVTPSGLGLREALFAVVLQMLAGATVETSVAAGLLVSTMLLSATVVGGGLALLLPSPEARSDQHGSSPAN